MEKQRLRSRGHYVVRDKYFSLRQLYIYTRLPGLIDKLYARNGEYYVSLINKYVENSINELRRKGIPVESRVIANNVSSGYYDYLVEYSFELYGKPLYYAMFDNVLAPATPRSRGGYYFHLRGNENSFGFIYFNGLSLLQAIVKAPSNEVTLINSSIDKDAVFEEINNTFNKLLYRDGLINEDVDVNIKIYDGYLTIYDSGESSLTIKPGYLVVYKVTPCSCNKLYVYRIAYLYGVEEPIYTKYIFYTQCLSTCNYTPEDTSSGKTRGSINNTNPEITAPSEVSGNKDESWADLTHTTTSRTTSRGVDRDTVEEKTLLINYLVASAILVFLIASAIVFIKRR